MPVHNDAPYIRRCVDSILGQTYDALEILLIDDGSTDGSGNICDEYGLKDDRVRVMHKQNEGTVSARGCGLENARGALVGFVDGDDWIDGNMYGELVEFYFRKGCPDIVSSGLALEYPKSGRQETLMDGAEEGAYGRRDIEQQLVPELIYNHLTGKSSILTSVCSKIIDKAVAQKAMGHMRHTLTLGEDGAYVYFLMGCCGSIAVMHKAFYHYEQHEDSQNYKTGIDSIKKLGELNEAMIVGMGRLGWKDDARIGEQVKYYVGDYLCRVIGRQFGLELNPYTYLFPFARCDRNSRILLYGAGVVGRCYERCLERSGFAKEIIWADRDYEKLRGRGMNVMPVKEALQQNYDYIVIAIDNEAAAKSVLDGFLVQGIAEEKIVWEKPIRLRPYI